MATIKDVAKKAGVSIATVSAVLNNTRFVSDSLKDRVSRAIEDLNYQPNRLARALKKNESKTIAYLLPAITNPFFPEMLKGIEDVSSAEGYNVIVCNTDLNPEKIRKYTRMLVESRIEGVILSSPGGEDILQLSSVLKDNGIPLVVLHGPRSLTKVDRVLADDEQGGYLATRHLLELGHRRIAFLGVDGSTTARLRLEGYKRAFAEMGIVVLEDLIYLGQSFTEEVGYQLAIRVFEAKDLDKPTAVLACNDPMALGVLTALEEKGLRVPEDVSLVGFDDTVASMVRPKLTSVAFPKYEMGWTAAEMLLKKIHGESRSDCREVILCTRLEARESTREIK